MTILISPWGILDDDFAASFDADKKAGQKESTKTAALRLKIERYLNSTFLAASPLLPFVYGYKAFPKYEARLGAKAIKQSPSVVTTASKAVSTVGSTVQTAMILAAIVGVIIVIKELK